LWRAGAALRALAAGAAVACGTGSVAGAHGFGQRYDLPLPLSLYLTGTAAAVAVSFVIVGLFVRELPGPQAAVPADLRATRLARLIGHPGLAIATALKLAALGLFAVTVAAGLIGNPDPYRNIAPTMVWIIFWVSFAYVSAFVGNLWPLINPWRTLFEGAEWLNRRIAGRGLSLNLAYPAPLGVWPAVLLLLAFSWVELVHPAPAVPSNIAWFAITYSILTWAGMIAFGGETWLRHGEVFTLVFGILARFAPVQSMAPGRAPHWTLRAPGAGLLDAPSLSISMTALVLLLLSSVLYDGALGTPEWTEVENALAARLLALGNPALLIRTGGLVAFWVVFFGAYLAVSFAMRVAMGGRLAAIEIARSFAMTLVPIAIGYHIAHYLTYLLVQGQYIIPLASDPFGYGWNLLGTAGYRIDIGVVGARFAWYAAVTAILLGHIAAVYLAHVKALRLLPTRSEALRSQVPLTALMVVYTFVSLSILAEPIAEYRTPALPLEVSASPVAVPEDAVLPEPGSGRLQPVGPGKLASQKLTYRMLGSAFHDGTRTSVADLLYAFMFAYRWGSLRAGEEPHYDPSIDAATAVMRARLLGLRMVGVDTASKSIRFGDFEYVRELLVVEVYTTTTPIDPVQDAVVAPPWSTLPWHLIVLLEEAVSRGYAAFSREEAAGRGVEWLDPVHSDELKQKLAVLVETFEREGYRPEILRSLVSAEDARKRWAALAAFYKSHGHFLVTNGPYRLESWSPDAVVLEVFRDLSYPLGVGSFDSYAIPRRAHITKVERQNDRITLLGDIELVMKYQRSYDIVRQPMQSVSAEVLKRSAPQVRYLVTDAGGRAVLAGQVDIAGDKAFHLDLSGRLPSGRFTLLAEITVNGNAMSAAIERIPIEVAPGP
jgi:hypothetical protein